MLMILSIPAFAWSPKQPEHHQRYSPNTKFFLDFNPETNVHTVFATASPNNPLWSIQSDAFWPYKHDESDGCLFVANDGLSIAGQTWVHLEGSPAGYLAFDGLEFCRSDGTKTAYRISELKSGKMPVLDSPVRIISDAIHGSKYRRGVLIRSENGLRAKTIGMRSFSFSLRTGQVTSWCLNWNYFACLAFVYVPPVWLLMRWIVRRCRGCAIPETEQRSRGRGIQIKNIGMLLVMLNSLGFAFGVLLDSYGGVIDQIGAQFCRVSYQIAFILVPVTLVFSAVGLASRPRRFDVLGPWLSTMSALAIVAMNSR